MHIISGVATLINDVLVEGGTYKNRVNERERESGIENSPNALARCKLTKRVRITKARGLFEVPPLPPPMPPTPATRVVTTLNLLTFNYALTSQKDFGSTSSPTTMTFSTSSCR